MTTQRTRTRKIFGGFCGSIALAFVASASMVMVGIGWDPTPSSSVPSSSSTWIFLTTNDASSTTSHEQRQQVHKETIETTEPDKTWSSGVVARVVKGALGDLYDPPQPVPLLNNSRTSPAAAETLIKRHECLQAIRTRQHNLLMPILSAAAAAGTGTNSSLLPTEVHVLLMDPAYIPNVGDQMITVCEQSWAQMAIDTLLLQWRQQQQQNNKNRTAEHPKITYHECHVAQAQSFANKRNLRLVPSCSDLLFIQQQHQQDLAGPSSATTTVVRLALWHGGGNWGDLWPPIQDLRTKSFQPLLKAGYTIIGMPQSLHFSSGEAEQRNAQQMRKHIGQGLGLVDAANREGTTSGGAIDNQLRAHAKKRVFLTWREQASYDKALQLYPHVSHLLVPDIAFQLGPYRPPNLRNEPNDNDNNGRPAAQVDILLLLRNDHESVVERDGQSVKSILAQLQDDAEEEGGGQPITWKIVEWSARLDLFPTDGKTNKNFLFTDTAIGLLNLGRVVVCDRLHATILAYLSGLSFVYLDQMTGKISKTLDVALASHRSCHRDYGNGEWSHFSTRNTLVPRPPWWTQADNLKHGLQVAVRMLQAMKSDAGAKTTTRTSFNKSMVEQVRRSGMVSHVVEKALGNLYDPPQPVPLLNASVAPGARTKTLVKRHECLLGIRTRQQNLLMPILSAAAFGGGTLPTEIRVLLVDPAYHDNVGDHMITLAEEGLVERVIDALVLQWQHRQNPRNRSAGRPRITYHECHAHQAQIHAENYTNSLFIPSCTDLLLIQQQQQDLASPSTTQLVAKLALWHGGGNWGDLWPPIQELRTKSFQQLLKSGYTIVGMPQSLFFSSSEAEQRSSQEVRTQIQLGLGLYAENEGRNGSAFDNQLSVQAKKRMFLTWREQASYDKARVLYPFVSHLLVPDIAFQLGPFRPPPAIKSDPTKNNGRPAAQVDILLFLRIDHESVVQRDEQGIKSILSQLYDTEDDDATTFKIVDWSDRLDLFPTDGKTNKNFLFTDTAVKLLNLGRVVVCDRLHATILSYLSGLSFVHLDQVSGKISKTLSVAMASHQSCLGDNGEMHADDFSTANKPPPPWWARANNLTHGLEMAVRMLQAMKPVDETTSMEKKLLREKARKNVVATVVRKTLGSLYDPPRPVPLLTNATRAQGSATLTLVKRHECLQAIRRRQQSLLMPIISDAAAARNTNSSVRVDIQVLLVDPAYHPNVGDHMITLAEEGWAQRAIDELVLELQKQQGQDNTKKRTASPPHPRTTYHECNVLQAQSYADIQRSHFVPSCSDLLAQQQKQNVVSSQSTTRIVVRLALWHGGGNWGDFWPPIQDLRTKSLEPLLKAGYTIIGMPQSLFFSNGEQEQRSGQQVREQVRQGLGLNANNDNQLSAEAKKRLFLTWREQASYDKARKLYPFATHLLVPHISFRLGPFRIPSSANDSNVTNNKRRLAAQVDILLLLRTDRESVVKRGWQGVKSILSQLEHDTDGQRPFTFKIVDWPDRLDWKSKNGKNFLFTDTAIQLLNSGRVVVCDRLHAAVLAYLSGMSFVYLDQVSGKLSKTMDVAMASHRSCHRDDGGGEWSKQENTTDSLVPPPWWARADNLTHGLQMAVQMLHVIKRRGSGVPEQGQ